MKKFIYKYKEHKKLKFYDDFVIAENRKEAEKFARLKVKKLSQIDNVKYCFLDYTMVLEKYGVEKTYSFRFKKYAARNEKITANHDVTELQYIKAHSRSQAIEKCIKLYGKNYIQISTFKLIKESEN